MVQYADTGGESDPRSGSVRIQGLPHPVQSSSPIGKVTFPQARVASSQALQIRALLCGKLFTKSASPAKHRLRCLAKSRKRYFCGFALFRRVKNLTCETLLARLAVCGISHPRPQTTRISRIRSLRPHHGWTASAFATSPTRLSFPRTFLRLGLCCGKPGHLHECKHGLFSHRSSLPPTNLRANLHFGSVRICVLTRPQIKKGTQTPPT